MKRRKIIPALSVFIFVIAVLTMPGTANAQQAGFGRTDLQHHDLSTPGFEVVQVRVEIAPGAEYPRQGGSV